MHNVESLKVMKQSERSQNPLKGKSHLRSSNTTASTVTSEHLLAGLTVMGLAGLNVHNFGLVK